MAVARPRGFPRTAFDGLVVFLWPLVRVNSPTGRVRAWDGPVAASSKQKVSESGTLGANACSLICTLANASEVLAHDGLKL